MTEETIPQKSRLAGSYVPLGSSEKVKALSNFTDSEGFESSLKSFKVTTSSEPCDIPGTRRNKKKKKTRRKKRTKNYKRSKASKGSKSSKEFNESNAKRLDENEPKVDLSDVKLKKILEEEVDRVSESDLGECSLNTSILKPTSTAIIRKKKNKPIPEVPDPLLRRTCEFSFDFRGENDKSFTPPAAVDSLAGSELFTPHPSKKKEIDIRVLNFDKKLSADHKKPGVVKAVRSGIKTMKKRGGSVFIKVRKRGRRNGSRIEFQNFESSASFVTQML